MKNVFKHGIAIHSIALSVLLAVAGTASAEVHFRDISFDQAKALAAKEHKAIMVDFYTTWCVWCKTLDRNTYSDENVGKIADAKFISVKIDAEKGEGKTLAKTYGISGYPTIMFFDKDGKEIDRVVGYEDASRFARSLENASVGGSKAAVGKVESATPTTDPKIWLVAANYYAQQNQNEKALGAFRKVLVLDPNNKQGQNAEATYGVAFFSTGDEQWKTLDEALVKFPDEVDADQANRMLLRHDLDQKNNDAAARRMDQWAMKHPNDGSTFNYFAWTAAMHGVLLDQAESYAKRGVILAQTPVEKASVMDTRAEVLFKMGKLSDASEVEASALALLDPNKDKKLYNELATQKAKFDKGGTEASTTGTTNH
jgi:thioredoxin-related protein